MDNVLEASISKEARTDSSNPKTTIPTTSDDAERPAAGDAHGAGSKSTEAEPAPGLTLKDGSPKPAGTEKLKKKKQKTGHKGTKHCHKAKHSRHKKSKVVRSVIPDGGENSSNDDSSSSDDSEDEDDTEDLDDSDLAEEDSELDFESEDDTSDSDTSDDGDASSKKKKGSKAKSKAAKKLKQAAKKAKSKKKKESKKAKGRKVRMADSDSEDSDPATGVDDQGDSISRLADNISVMTTQLATFQQALSRNSMAPALGGIPPVGDALNPYGNPIPGLGLGGLGQPIPIPPGDLRYKSPPPPPPGLGRRGRNLNRRKRAGNLTEDDDSDVDSLGDPLPGRSRSRRGKKKGPKKGRPEFKRVDMVWDSNLFAHKLQDTNEMNSDSQYEDYIFHVRRTFDVEGKYRATYVDIKSKLLRECLQDVIGTVQGLSLVDETPKMDPNMLFLYLDDLQAHAKQLKKAKPSGSKKNRKREQRQIDNKRKELKVLIKYINKDYAKIKTSLHPMLKNGLITFDLLWALWKPDTLAYSATYGATEDPRVFKVEMSERQASIMKGEFYYVDGKYFEFDGKKFGYGAICEEIADFPGARKITSLPCYPLQYHKNEKKLREQLIERGKKFVALAGVHYRAFSGMAYQKRRKGAVMKFNVQKSRIMVDPSIFRRINPNYFVSLVRPKDHDIISNPGCSDSEDEDGEYCGDCCGGCDSDDSDAGGEKIKFVTKVFKDKKGEIHMARVPKDLVDGDEATEVLKALPDRDGKIGKADKATPEESEESRVAEDPEGEKAVEEFTDEEYLIASPVVLGFSFSEKLWLEFSVSSVQEIQWNEKAWDSLVLEPATKDLISALVKSRKFSAVNRIDDVIQGKGKGLVTVLHGPPGTGKTLTAEGISELLKCPLYMASAGELGTDSRYLEAELQKMLDICHAWGAILLLDEADVFLEKRNMHEIHRNALVSIFLRQLEYFQGILFLTTNRVETFDEAFQSRIHIALRYENLDSKAKQTIFRLFIERARATASNDGINAGVEAGAFTDAELETLSRHELNGREIKNVIGSAQDLAVNKGEALALRHVKQVLDVHAKFGRDLKGGTGYEDAMRSYF